MAAVQEWEAEWNSSGLASGLSKEEYRNRKRQKLASRIGDSVKTALQRATLDDSDALEQLMRTKAGAFSPLNAEQGAEGPADPARS